MLGFLLLAQHLLKWFKLAAEANRLSISAAHGVPFLPPSPCWRLVWCSTKPSVCRLAAKKGVEMSWRYLPHGESTSSHLRKIRVVSVIISAYKLTHTHTHIFWGTDLCFGMGMQRIYIHIIHFCSLTRALWDFVIVTHGKTPPTRSHQSLLAYTPATSKWKKTLRFDGSPLAGSHVAVSFLYISAPLQMCLEFG